MATILSTLSSQSGFLVANKPGGTQALQSYCPALEWIIENRQGKTVQLKPLRSVHHLTLFVVIVNEHTIITLC